SKSYEPGPTIVKPAADALAPGHAQLLRQRDEIVLADALQHEEHSGRLAGIGDEVGTPGRYGIGLPALETHLLLGRLQKYPDCPVHDIERVMHVVVVMPGNLLGRADLQLGNAKAGTLRMIGATLHLIERARILHCLHLFLHRRARTAILHAARLCARTAA